MKKSYLFLAAAGLVLSACSNNDLKNDIEEIETPIDFLGYTQNSTKAEIKNEKALALAGGFAVYGYKYKDGLTWSDWSSTAGNVIFKNVNVKTTATSGDSEEKNDYVWTYENKKYWDKTSAYKFYAVAPYEGTPNYSISNDGKFTISSVASGLAANSKDYVIDRVVNEVAINNGGNAYTKVGFDFHHIMAKVDFKLKMSESMDDADKVKVQSIKMSGWDNATGTFTQTKTDGTWATLDCSEWVLGTTVAGNVEVLTVDDASKPIETALLTKTAEVLNTNTFIMVPQSFEADVLTFTIDYTVNGEPFTAQVGKIGSTQTWGTDSHITYTLTVGPKAIEFDVTSVCDFCAPSGGQNYNGTIQ